VSHSPRPRFYYGWVITGVAFVTGGFSAGINIWSPSMFVLPMRAELGWSLTGFFLALTIRSVTGALTMPLLGHLLDRSGWARRLAIFSTIVTGLGLMGCKWVGEVPAFDFLSGQLQFYLLFGVFSGAGTVGSGFVIANSVLPKWFIQKRGRAIGIAAAGTAMGPLAFPFMTQALIDALGWRDAWLALGLISIGAQLPLVLFIKTRPEDVGLLPDGAERPDDVTRPAPRRRRRIADVSLTRAEALRTRTFWFWASAMMVANVGVSGFQPSWVPFLQENGFSNNIAVAGTAIYGGIGGVSRVIWGMLGERISVRKLIIVQMALTGATVPVLLYAANNVMVVAFMVSAGLTMGAYFILQPLMTAELFGRGHLGAIAGITQPMLTFSAALSPIVVGQLRDLRGDYFLAFTMATAAWIVGAAIVFLTPPIRRAPEPAVQPAR